MKNSRVYKRPVNTRACMHASELVTSIGCHEFARAHKHAEGALASKGIEHASLDRGERENKPFARELVHASIKLEMSCTIVHNRVVFCT